MDVQNLLAYSYAKNRMLAIVVDTNTPDLKMAIFTPKRDGSMNNNVEMNKTFSLEVLYQWGKKTREESVPANSGDVENYFHLPVNQANVQSVLFSAKAVNDIDEILYTSNKGLIGYFFGYVQGDGHKQQNIVIEKCMTSHSNEAIGCLIADAFSSYQDILAKFDNIINRYRFFVLYRRDVELYIGLKNENDLYVPEEPRIVSFSLEKMKEWTRRRRI
jgi:hypothetical protein